MTIICHDAVVTEAADTSKTQKRLAKQVHARHEESQQQRVRSFSLTAPKVVNLQERSEFVLQIMKKNRK